MLTKAQRIRVKRFFKYAALLLAAISAILTPLPEFGLITTPWQKWAIYSVLVISVLGNSIPGLSSLLPENARHKQAEVTIKKALDIICTTLNAENPAKYRACIFSLPTANSKVVTVSHNSSNMDGAPDLDIKLQKLQGCTGAAWAKGKPVVSDLTIKPKDGAPQWGLTDDQVRVTKHLKAVLSLPIRLSPARRPIAILSIDSDNEVASYFLKPKTKELAGSYAAIFANLLTAVDRHHPLK